MRRRRQSSCQRPCSRWVGWVWVGWHGMRWAGLVWSGLGWAGRGSASIGCLPLPAQRCPTHKLHSDQDSCCHELQGNWQSKTSNCYMGQQVKELSTSQDPAFQWANEGTDQARRAATQQPATAGSSAAPVCMHRQGIRCGAGLLAWRPVSACTPGCLHGWPALADIGACSVGASH